MEPNQKELILDHADIQKKVSRIAFEIYEHNYAHKRLLIAGIGNRGGYLATQIVKKLKEISTLEVEQIGISKIDDVGNVALEKEVEGMKKANFLLVDDVLYSGTTMFNSIVALLEYNPNRVQVAVLIDRGHRNLPVRPDFVGLELATTLKQHVTVEVSEKGRTNAYLQ